jgi:hypothetical protein
MSNHIETFLSHLQSLVKEKGAKILDRPENRSMLDIIEFNQLDIENTLLSLTKSDYCEGPVPDDKDRPDDVWIFGRNIKGHDVYIKLAIVEKKKRKNVVCISFHEPTHPLYYPYC